MTRSVPDTAGKRLTLRRAILRGVGLGLLVHVVVFLIHSFAANNLHTVVPGQIFRSSQMSGRSLERVIQKLGIRTVINLRGPCLDQEWYRDECRTTHQLNVSQEDICFSAGHLPPVDEVHHLVDVIDRSEYPILFHCFRGVDRTGLATTIALLLKTDTPLAEARKSLSMRFVHLPFGRTGHLDRFLDMYERWLTEQGQEHTRSRCREWLMHGYHGDCCKGRIELLGLIFPGSEKVQPPPAADDYAEVPNHRRMVPVPRDVPIGVHIRCHNTSDQPWVFHPNDNTGIHAYWHLLDAADIMVMRGRAGRFHARVQPGEHIDLTLPIPPMKSAGRYHMQATMIEEQHCFFHEIALEQLELELEVP
jgi:predicted protein tyrosine phosphatase